MRYLTLLLLLISFQADALLSRYDRYCRPPLRGYFGGRATGIVLDAPNPDFPILDHRTIALGGVQGSFYYQQPQRVYLNIDAFYEESSTRMPTDNVKYRVRRYQVISRIGATLGLGSACRYLVSPYLGYGFREFRESIRNSGDTPLTPAGDVLRTQRFIYQSWFTPVGLRLTYQPGYCWEIGLVAEWQPHAQAVLNVPQVAEVLPYMDPPLFVKVQPNYSVRVNGADSYLIEVPLSMKAGPTTCLQVDATVIPFYNHVVYRAVTSNVANFTLSVPERHLDVFGVRLEIGIRL